MSGGFCAAIALPMTLQEWNFQAKTEPTTTITTKTRINVRFTDRLMERGE